MASSKKHKIMGTAAGAVVRQFTMQVAQGGAATAYVDIAKMLSAYNQRLYRQGMTYLVRVESSQMSGSSTSDPPDVGDYNIVLSLPNNWQVRKAWAKAFKMYRKQISAIVGRSGELDTKARWNDFKIGFEHGTTWADYKGVPGNGASVEPTAAAFAYGDGEWDKSFITDLVADTRKTCNMFGVEDTGTEYGLLAMYNTEPGTIGPDPNILTTPDPYMEWVTDDDPPGTVIQDYATQGNEPPYNPEQLQVVATQNYCSLNGLQPVSTPWIEAPCGLLKIVTPSSMATNYLTFHVAPGNYKGVCAESLIAKVN